MKRLGCAVLALGVIAVCCGPGAGGSAWAQAFGMIAATVQSADDPRGLTVRSEPSASAPVVGFLPVGTEVKNCNDFRDGWVRVEAPSRGNWVNMAHLKPKGGDATVAAVDKPELCLAIRKGPYSSYEKVGCAELGQKLKLSGVWSATNWARLEDGNWVDASKIETDLLVCTTPLAAGPPVEPQATAPPGEPETLPAIPPAQPSVSLDYPVCPPYGVSYAPPCYVGLPAPVFYGDFGAFGYFPGVFPVVSVAVRSYGRGYYRHHGGPHPYYRHGPGPGPHPHRHDRMVPGAARGATPWNPTPRHFSGRNVPGIANNAAAINASRAYRSGRTAPNFARTVPSAGMRSATGSAFRNAGISRGRGMNVSSSSQRGAFQGGAMRAGSFRGGGASGGSFRGGGFQGGGRRR